MTATNPTPDADAARDEHRWTHGDIIDMEAAAYAEDAARYGNAHIRTPGVGDRVILRGDPTAEAGVIESIRRDESGQVWARVVWGVDGESPSRPMSIELAVLVLDTHSVASTTDGYFASGCGADVLARDEGPAGRWSRGAVLAQESARSIADRAAAWPHPPAQVAADMAAVAEFIRDAAPALTAFLAEVGDDADIAQVRDQRGTAATRLADDAMVAAVLAATEDRLRAIVDHPDVTRALNHHAVPAYAATLITAVKALRRELGPAEPTFFERVAEVRALADDANRVEVEAALPGEWVVSVGTSANDERAAVAWVDLPGRHTLRGAAEQVRHLTIEGYVREVRILRA
jgi:hypothetical protein